ncbi:unnamed protein product [Microthlaspi erraticum]|uniref:Uncharacterized protein n=1 Tax=Microthlaspi erraticum TaxID=1685480 RepID=A0A6D2ILS3_9BRAS|nr:unnamed protein product [Microthlaspi erraticum]
MVSELCLRWWRSRRRRNARRWSFFRFHHHIEEDESADRSSQSTGKRSRLRGGRTAAGRNSLWAKKLIESSRFIGEDAREMQGFPLIRI